MSQESNTDSEQEVKAYHEPSLMDYGKMSELTQAISGDTGDDGGGSPSSYTASIF